MAAWFCRRPSRPVLILQSDDAIDCASSLPVDPMPSFRLLAAGAVSDNGSEVTTGRLSSSLYKTIVSTITARVRGSRNVLEEDPPVLLL